MEQMTINQLANLLSKKKAELELMEEESEEGAVKKVQPSLHVID